MIFNYEIDSSKRYSFRYFKESGLATVNYPNGTTSQASDVRDFQMFGEWVDSIIGPILPPDTFSQFQYIFQRSVRNKLTDFNIQAAFLVSNLMSDKERKEFRSLAVDLDNQYFDKTGYHFDLDQVQNIYIARHRIDANAAIWQFETTIKAS